MHARTVCAAIALTLIAARALAAPSCPIESPAIEAAKPNKLYLTTPLIFTAPRKYWQTRGARRAWQ